MLLSAFSKLSTAISLATYIVGASSLAIERSAQICYDTETAAQLCYTLPETPPQDVLVADVTFAAEYLRAYGAELKTGCLFTMLTTDGDDCPEWSLYSHGSVLITANYLNSALNSSVLYADIAPTIDGRSAATAAQQAAALIGCGTDGGSEGVLVNTTNPAYNTATYLAAGYTPQGILVKVVASGN